jgi:hypothetical protein
MYQASKVVVRTLCASILAVAGLISAHAQASSTSTEHLARQADAVFVGKVREMKSEWTRNRASIVTRVTLGVGQVIKGQPSTTTVTIVTPGGEVDGVGELYTHMASFKQQEEVVVFLERAQTGEYRVAGGSLGKFTVEHDPKTGRPMIGGDVPLEDFSRNMTQAVKTGPTE